MALADLKIRKGMVLATQLSVSDTDFTVAAQDYSFGRIAKLSDLDDTFELNQTIMYETIKARGSIVLDEVLYVIIEEPHILLWQDYVMPS